MNIKLMSRKELLQNKQMIDFGHTKTPIKMDFSKVLVSSGNIKLCICELVLLSHG